MTRAELLRNRIRRSADALSYRLTQYADIHRTSPVSKDNAGAVRPSPTVIPSLPCLVVPSEPVEVVVAGRVMGVSDALIYLTAGTDIKETDHIHVRDTRLPNVTHGNPGYGIEHQIFTVIGTNDAASNRHLTAVYVARRR